ncbi:MAG: KAP family NTPase, partial [Anaerolineae bacterium]|nr:KAP family NTPase [Anaerolineae bacterium]
MFIPDRSAEKSTEDKLNRAPFAHKLADTIRDWKLEESIVIGLYGPWGCGKTSVLNFSVERLRETTKEWEIEKKPIIIWFNPWSFSEQEKLLQAFFQQIFAEIKKVDPKAGEDLKQTIKKFAQVLGALEPIPGVGQIFSAGQKFVDIFVSDKTIQDTKEEVSSVFRKLKRRILIIIDDVDRLNREEIRLLFQAIKINADFPNTIYLVAFDRSVVENALSNAQGVSGREYLEKIVQVGFNVPDPDPTLLNKILFDELDRILNSALTEPLDRERWLKPYFCANRRYFYFLVQTEAVSNRSAKPKQYLSKHKASSAENCFWLSK